MSRTLLPSHSKAAILRYFFHLERYVFNVLPCPICAECGKILEAALKGLLLSQTGEEHADKELGRLLGAAREGRLLNRATQRDLNKVNKLRIRSVHDPRIDSKNLKPPDMEEAYDAYETTRSFLLEHDLVDEQDLERCRNAAILREHPAPPKPLLLDRQHQRGAIDILTESGHGKLHLIVAEGEIGQGHRFLSDLAHHKFKSRYKNLQRYDVKWRREGASNSSLGELLESLGRAIGRLPDSKQFNEEQIISELHNTIRERLKHNSIFIRHWINKPMEGDLDLCRDYVRRFWKDLNVDLPNSLVVVIEICRVQPGGHWFSRASRLSRKERARSAQIAEIFKSHGAEAMRELGSVTEKDLIIWLGSLEHSTDPTKVQQMAKELFWSSSKGRYELALAAYGIDMNRRHAVDKF